MKTTDFKHFLNKMPNINDFVNLQLFDLKAIIANIENVSFGNRLKDYGILMKFKLSLTVVFSAVMAYLIALEGHLNWLNVAVLFLGGFFTTGAANALNQVLEKDYDKLMKRTEKSSFGNRSHDKFGGCFDSRFIEFIGCQFIGGIQSNDGFFRHGFLDFVCFCLYTNETRV